MSKKSFVIDTVAFGNEVMKADYMYSLIRDTANEIAQTAGDGYEASSEVGRKRALGMVWTATPKAKKDNDENNTLQKAAYPLQVVNK